MVRVTSELTREEIPRRSTGNEQGRYASAYVVRNQSPDRRAWMPRPVKAV